MRIEWDFEIIVFFGNCVWIVVVGKGVWFFDWIVVGVDVLGVFLNCNVCGGFCFGK